MTPLNDLILSTWNFSDPAGSFTKFNQLIAETDDELDKHRLMTQAGRCLGLQGKFDEEREILAEVEAFEHHADDLFARYYLEMGRVLNSSGKPEEAIPLFEEALAFSQKAGADYLAIDAAHMLAIAHKVPQSLEWGDRAMKLIEKAKDEDAKKWRGSVLNNHGWALADAEKWEEALVVFHKALEARLEQGVETPITIAKYCISHALRKLNRPEEALNLLEEVTEQDGFIDEERAEALLALGRTAESKHHFAKAYEALKDFGWVDDARKERLKQLSQ